MMTDLSPAAQAVLDAATKGFWSSAFNSEGKGAAAALRAAANQLTSSKAIDQLRAIAAELDNTNHTSEDDCNG